MPQVHSEISDHAKAGSTPARAMMRIAIVLLVSMVSCLCRWSASAASQDAMRGPITPAEFLAETLGIEVPLVVQLIPDSIGLTQVSATGSAMSPRSVRLYKKGAADALADVGLRYDSTGFTFRAVTKRIVAPQALVSDAEIHPHSLSSGVAASFSDFHTLRGIGPGDRKQKVLDRYGQPQSTDKRTGYSVLVYEVRARSTNKPDHFVDVGKLEFFLAKDVVVGMQWEVAPEFCVKTGEIPAKDATDMPIAPLEFMGETLYIPVPSAVTEAPDIQKAPEVSSYEIACGRSIMRLYKNDQMNEHTADMSLAYTPLAPGFSVVTRRMLSPYVPIFHSDKPVARVISEFGRTFDGYATLRGIGPLGYRDVVLQTYGQPDRTDNSWCKILVYEPKAYSKEQPDACIELGVLKFFVLEEFPLGQLVGVLWELSPDLYGEG